MQESVGNLTQVHAEIASAGHELDRLARAREQAIAQAAAARQYLAAVTKRLENRPKASGPGRVRAVAKSGRASLLGTPLRRRARRNGKRAPWHVRHVAIISRSQPYLAGESNQVDPMCGILGFTRFVDTEETCARGVQLWPKHVLLYAPEFRASDRRAGPGRAHARGNVCECVSAGVIFPRSAD